MSHARNLTAACTLATLGLMAATAQAAPASPGWYLGVDAGRSELTVAGRSALFPEPQADQSDTAFALHGGYRFTRYFAVEASYADLGTFDYTVECPAVCIPEAFPRQVDASIDRLDVALLGIVPFSERAEVYARVGMAQTQVDVTVTSMLEGTRGRSSDSSDVVYGLGLRVHFDAPWSLRLQWERSEADIDASSADVDTLWLGGEYRFGR